MEFVLGLRRQFKVLEMFTILRERWNDSIPLAPGTYQIVDIYHRHYRDAVSGRYPVKWWAEVVRVDPFIDEDFAEDHDLDLECGEMFNLIHGAELPSGEIVPPGEYIVVTKTDEYGFANIEPIMAHYPY